MINKKKLLNLGLIGLGTLGLVSAGLITNYFTQNINVSVKNPFSVEGDTTIHLEGVESGDVIFSEPFTLINEGDSDRFIDLLTIAEEGIEVSYIAGAELSKKIVDFENSNWTILDDEENKVIITYTAVGDNFEANVEEPIAGYELVYYPDQEDRFEYPNEVVRISEIDSNLPFSEDFNSNEYNYCELDGYTNCHGAKLWYVPSDAILVDGSLDWSRADEFYFETNLIQYNSDGLLTIYGNSELELTPKIETDELLETGDYTVTTEINPQ